MDLAGQPGRSECCHRCNADLRVCLNCLSYDPRVAHQCRDRRAEPVAEKHAGDFCEFSISPGETGRPNPPPPRARTPRGRS